MFSKITKLFMFLGIDFRKGYLNIKNLKWFFNDYKELKKQLNQTSDFKFGKWYPMLNDKFAESGSASGHYFHQDLLVSQRVFKNNPTRHVDIGSSVGGLVAHIASFREIEVFDIRPLTVEIQNITFLEADFMDIDSRYYDYCDSLSCLHVIEHFGLGRYNEPINSNGHVIGLENMYKILKKDGTFHFSTPMGSQRIEFNAHRVFNLDYLVNLFKDKYIIKNFSYVDDAGALHMDVDFDSKDASLNFNCNFGCAIFELTKI